MRRFQLHLLLAGCAAAPLLAQSPDFDLVHQLIEVENFDWDSTAFDGRVTSTVVAGRGGLDSVTLAMGHRLQVRSVTGRSSLADDPLRFSRPGDSIVVRLARPAARGDTVRFAIAYRGRVEQGRGLYFFKAEPRPRRAPQIYSGGGTDGNPNWIPTVAAPDDKATWELVATVPRGFTVVSNGRLLSDRAAPGRRHTMRWQQERPASTYLISLVVAPLAQIRDRWRDVPVDYYVNPADRNLARPLFGFTPDLIEIYGRLTGVPYPWVKYAQTTVTDFIGGMENVSATTLVDWLPDRRACRDRPWFRWLLIPHELAHQWFGDLVTARDWSHYWLNEGMAEFMPGQYWGLKLGPHAEQDFYLNEYLLLLDRDARRRVPLASYNSNVVYQKGALALAMLKQYLGPERFWAGIHRYLTRHAYGNATSDDLRRAFESASGSDLAWFWNQWVYAAGHPEFAVSAAYDSAAGAVTLVVRQTQVDTAHADSTGRRVVTPIAFRVPVVVRIGTARGDVTARVWLQRRDQTIRVPGVRSPPLMVVFDDGNRVLKALRFDQPTRWLATQLQREPDLWNRWWVIQQLAGRPEDPSAAAALVRAAVGADYPLTRAQAATALGSFPPARALAALRRVAADSSSEVRTSAATALGEVGGVEALGLVREMWRRDSSYETRAAALTAYARLDPAGSRSAVLAGLATGSYRDVIRTAAIGAALQRPDSGLVAAVDRAAGQLPLATAALALLARRGDDRAAAALRHRLDDERSWVREWALQAAERVPAR